MVSHKGRFLARHRNALVKYRNNSQMIITSMLLSTWWIFLTAHHHRHRKALAQPNQKTQIPPTVRCYRMLIKLRYQGRFQLQSTVRRTPRRTMLSSLLEVSRKYQLRRNRRCRPSTYLSKHLCCLSLQRGFGECNVCYAVVLRFWN